VTRVDDRPLVYKCAAPTHPPTHLHHQQPPTPSTNQPTNRNQPHHPNRHPSRPARRSAVDAAIESGVGEDEDGIEEAFELIAEVRGRGGGFMPEVGGRVGVGVDDFKGIE